MSTIAQKQPTFLELALMLSVASLGESPLLLRDSKLTLSSLSGGFGNVRHLLKSPENDAK